MNKVEETRCVINVAKKPEQQRKRASRRPVPPTECATMILMRGLLLLLLMLWTGNAHFSRFYLLVKTVLWLAEKQRRSSARYRICTVDFSLTIMCCLQLSVYLCREQLMILIMSDADTSGVTVQCQLDG